MELPDRSSYRSLDGVSRRQAPKISAPAISNPSAQPLKTSLPSPEPFAEQLATTPKPKGFWKRLAHFGKRLVPRTRKHAFLYTGGIILLAGGILGARLLLTSCKVFICKNTTGAVALQDSVDPTKLRGEGDGRVNILLMGVGGEVHKAGDLADSIMIVSLDPISKDVAMLSIPRDLYLKIPGYGSARINAAHAYGEEYNYPGGGPALMKETISQSLGVPIHYFARADFQGFKDAVGAVGGVDVNVDQPIYDYSYPRAETGGYETFQLAAGPQYMNPDVALKYARSRYSTSDFDRSKRQQKLLMAIKAKVLSIGTLTNPIKINSLIGTVGNHAKTDFTVDEMLKLIKIGGQIQDKQITQASLDNSPDNYLASSNVGGASVLVPKGGDFAKIRGYVRLLFIDGFIKNENASIEVLNGSTKPTLATDTAELLKSFGYNIQRVNDAASQSQSHTVIYDYTNGAKPYTIRYLEQRFGVKADRRQAPDDQVANISVIVGSDYNPQP